MGPVSLRGSWGRGGVPMLRRDPLTVRGSTGTGRDPREIGGSEENVASISSDHLGPREPAEVLGQILHPLRLPPSGRAVLPKPRPPHLHSGPYFCTLHSKGPTSCAASCAGTEPRLHACLRSAPHSQGIFWPFFFFFSRMWFCFTLLLFHLYFYFL